MIFTEVSNMENLVLTDEAKRVFNEALLDCKMGMMRGNSSAISAYNNFERFLKLNVVPVADLGWLYTYYNNQVEDLKTQIDPRLDGLKQEVGYMMNLLKGKYKFTEDKNTLLVELA